MNTEIRMLTCFQYEQLSRSSIVVRGRVKAVEENKFCSCWATVAPC